MSTPRTALRTLPTRLLRALALGVVGVLLLAQPAGASKPQILGGAVYGGGALDWYQAGCDFNTCEVRRPIIRLVSLRPTANRRRLTFLVNAVGENCGIEARVAKVARIGRNGAFKSSGSFRDSLPGITDSGRFKLTGAFEGGVGKAEGTLWMSWTALARDGRHLTCHASSSWYAVVPGARGAHGNDGDDLYGDTSQRSKLSPSLALPISLIYTTGYVSLVAASIEVPCPGGGEAASGVFYEQDMHVSHISFGKTSTFSEEGSVAGTSIEFTSILAGRIGARDSTGTWTITAKIVRKSDGSLIEQCGGQKVSWTASNYY